MIARKPGLCLTVMSATMSCDVFMKYFGVGRSQVIEVKSLEFPVSIRYVPDECSVVNPDGTLTLVGRDDSQKAVSETINVLNVADKGNVLVFMCGRSEVCKTVAELDNYLKTSKLYDVEVLPMYSSLSQAEQERVVNWDLNPLNAGKRLIVVSTNICETGVTIPNVTHVIDTMFEKRVVYDTSIRSLVLERALISQSSANQRSGRAGRTGPGNCIRLCSEEVFEKASKEPIPVADCLDSYVLRLLSMGEDPFKFDWVTMPSREIMQSTVRLLRSLGAVEMKSLKLTVKGKYMAEIPVRDVRQSCFIVEASMKGLLRESLEIVALLNKIDTMGLYKLVKDLPRGSGSDLLCIWEAFKSTPEVFTGRFSNISDDVQLFVDNIISNIAKSEVYKHYQLNAQECADINPVLAGCFVSAFRDRIGFMQENGSVELTNFGGLDPNEEKALGDLSVVANRESCAVQKRSADCYVVFADIRKAGKKHIVSWVTRIEEDVLEHIDRGLAKKLVRYFEDSSFFGRCAMLLRGSTYVRDNVQFKEITSPEVKLMCAVAAELVELGCEIFGGFLRDTLAAGDKAEDLDVLVPSGNADSVIRQMQARRAHTNLVVVDKGSKGANIKVRVIEVSWDPSFCRSTAKVGVDLANPADFAKLGTADLNVNNLKLTKKGPALKEGRSSHQGIADILQDIADRTFQVAGNFNIDYRKTKLLAKNKHLPPDRHWKERR
eukprot:TRINITY_DN7410_c0_g3_i2.p1 TRINITY_DN7410_c0_g3~~TRINITY_DN7410_c0_g3_i2.p1  ORF type:complete len:718 (-),score=186.59 TRINITY_DN7410_c0_g3_i2:59-2212(-)